MMRPDPDHVPTLAEMAWRSSPAAERETQSRRTTRLLVAAGAVGALVVAVAIRVIPAVAS